MECQSFSAQKDRFSPNRFLAFGALRTSCSQSFPFFPFFFLFFVPFPRAPSSGPILGPTEVCPPPFFFACVETLCQCLLLRLRQPPSSLLRIFCSPPFVAFFMGRAVLLRYGQTQRQSSVLDFITQVLSVSPHRFRFRGPNIPVRPPAQPVHNIYLTSPHVRPRPLFFPFLEPSPADCPFKRSP